MESFWYDYWWLIFILIITLPITSAIFFGIWLRKQASVNLETGATCWDSFSKFITAFTIIFSGAMLFGKYIDQHQQIQATKIIQVERELVLREVDFLKQKLLFDEKKFESKRAMLNETKRVAASIAAGNQKAPMLIRFEELYWGDLIGIQKPEGKVQEAMLNFRNQIKWPNRNQRLDVLSRNLSEAIKTELEESEKAILEQYRHIADLMKPKKGGIGGIEGIGVGPNQQAEI